MVDDLGSKILNSAFPFRTVCEVTREIHDLVHEHRAKLGLQAYEQILELLKEQAVMQKKMDARLRYYKADWLVDEGLEKTDNYTDKLMKREQRANASL